MPWINCACIVGVVDPPISTGPIFTSHPSPHPFTICTQDEEAGYGNGTHEEGSNGVGRSSDHRAIPLANMESFSGLSKTRTFEWHIQDYSVPVGSGKEKASKTILKGVAGRAENGTFSAIMGPSGCGKTSLLVRVHIRF